MRSNEYLKSLPKKLQDSVECAGGWLSNGIKDAAEYQCPRGVNKSDFMNMAQEYARLKDEESAAKFVQLEKEDEEKAAREEARDRRRQNHLTYGD